MPFSDIRYAIYTRQSVAKDEAFSSCDAQFGICRDFIEAEGPSELNIARFDDEGMTGAHTDRPALQAMLKEVEAGKIGKVVIYRLDRLTRSIRDSLDILDTFRQHNVEFLIVTSPDLGVSATDKFVLNIMASFAEFEREMIRSRLADTRAALKRQGKRLAGRVPYGYEVDPSTKQFKVNPVEAGHVLAIFDMAVDNRLPSEIAKVINKRGWRTKKTKSISGRESGGNRWTPRQVLDTLSNPVYIGAFADGKELRHGWHDAIVSVDLFRKVRQIVAARKQKDNSAPNQDSRPWPLQRKIVCPMCGRIMSNHETRYKNVSNRQYRCRSYAGGRPPCKRSFVRAPEMDITVTKVLADPDYIDIIPGMEGEDRRLVEEVLKEFRACNLAFRLSVLQLLVERVAIDRRGDIVSIKLDMDMVRHVFTGD